MNVTSGAFGCDVCLWRVDFVLHSMRPLWATLAAPVLVGVLLLACAPLAVEACPNSCWGHGHCDTDNACRCFRGWVGNDCGSRVCPRGVSIATTRQTDFNFDGDYRDNSFRQFVHTPDTGASNNSHFGPVGSISFLSNTLTVKMADALKTASDELRVGESIVMFARDAAHVFQIVDVVLNGSVFTVDKQNMVPEGLSEIPFFPLLATQTKPRGEWEQWPGDYAFKDAAHYMMECSNNGYCDTYTGTCKCFKGYTGHACQRQRCWSYCSEKGDCKTIAELAASHPVLLNNTISTIAGSLVITFDVDGIPATLSKNGGDHILIGNLPHVFTTAFHDGVRAVTLTETVPAVHLRSTPVWQRMEYKLWDANLMRSCECDPGYIGFDCSRRTCPRGDDPIAYTYDMHDPMSTTDSTKTSPYRHRHERQILDIHSSYGEASGNFTLRYYDEEVDTVYNSTRIPTIVHLTDACIVHGPNITFTQLLPHTALGIGDYVRVGSEYRQVMSLHTGDHRRDKYTQAVFDAPWHLAALTLLPDSTAATVNTGIDAFTIIVGGSGVASSLLKVGDYVMFNQEVRRVAALTLSGDKITHISVEYTVATHSIMPQTSGGVDYFSGFTHQPSATPIYVYSSATTYTAYLVTVASEIDKALKHLPMSPLPYLRVYNRLSGVLLSKCVSATTTSTTVSFTDCSTGNPAHLSAGSGLIVGSRLRIGTQVRTVTTITLSGDNITSVTVESTPAIAGNAITGTTEGYLLTGWRYVIDFSKGSNDFDEQGKAGDVRSVLCENSELTASIVLSKAATVTRGVPDRVAFSSALATGETLAVRDFIRIGNETRWVVSVVNATVYDVNEAFSGNARSTSAYIFDVGSRVDKIFPNSATGTFLSCHTTDFPIIRFKNPAHQVATVSSVDKTIVTHAGLVDARDIRKGDRVAMMHGTNAWEIRTVNAVLSPVSFETTKPWSTTHQAPLYNVYTGTTESHVCSNRGLCNEKTGLCECFRGFGGHNCHRFEIDVFSQIEPRLLKEYENYRQGIIVDDPYCPVKSTLPTGIITTVEKGKDGEDVVVRKIKVVDPRTGKMKYHLARKKYDPVLDRVVKGTEKIDEALSESVNVEDVSVVRNTPDKVVLPP